ncbi:MAG: porin family protein [Proteobacteria bacterium]|nr:porin family protein [Pseudomonadota bacterium]
MTRTIIAPAALALTLVVSPALALDFGLPSDYGYYGALQMGLSVPSDVDMDFGNGTSTEMSVDSGLSVAGALGFRPVSWVRVEGEVGHFSGELDAANNTDMSVTSYMANAFAEWQNTSDFTPYAGLGLGAATVSADGRETYSYGGTNYTFSTDDSDTVFAWQAALGVDYRFTNKLSADLGWRYLSTNDASLSTSINGSTVPVDAGMSANLIRMGMRYTF